ncbi:MAG: hypothetical protein B7Z36_02105 [Novosphingobium sp. 12-63-9]|nr:MAG: hypothetical protein B7Z36_02105 [Novosphingobium sp. 12-63-9]
MTIKAHFTVVDSAGVGSITTGLIEGLATQAMSLWSNNLAGDASIDVRIEIVHGLPGTVLATGGPTRGAVITHDGSASYWVSSVALQLEGNRVRNGSADPDITIQINADTLKDVYLDPNPETDNTPPAGKFDGLGLMLHEIGHGLGFGGNFDQSSATFLDDIKTPFDYRLLHNGNSVHFWGPNVRRAVGLTSGNYVHYDNFNAGQAFGLMTPAMYMGHAYGIGSLDLAILADTGLGTGTDDVLDLPFLPSMRGGSGNDKIIGGGGDNFLQGDEGNDSIVGGAGDDALFGGTGRDTLSGGEGNDFLDGGTHIDQMSGGAGDDIYIVDDLGDLVLEFVRGGTTNYDTGGVDTVRSSVTIGLGRSTGTRFVENLVITGTNPLWGLGNSLDNHITGNSAANDMSGFTGADTIRGGGGNDKLHGGLGRDVLIGGTGADSFVFDSRFESAASRDTISDFSHEQGDLITLSLKVMRGLTHTGGLLADQFYTAAGATRAQDATDRIVYNTSTGVLYYDSDGIGGHAANMLAALKGAPLLAFTDFEIIA